MQHDFRKVAEEAPMGGFFKTHMITTIPEKNDTARTKGEWLYKTISLAYCPYLKENIAFNSKGLEHLKYHKHGKARNGEDQKRRFRILHLAPRVISESRTLQGISRQQVFERVRIHNRTETRLVGAVFYEFIAVMDNTRVKVIVKSVENGEKYFWSIFPYWKFNKRSNSRELFTGSPDND